MFRVRQRRLRGAVDDLDLGRQFSGRERAAGRGLDARLEGDGPRRVGRFRRAAAACVEIKILLARSC